MTLPQHKNPSILCCLSFSMVNYQTDWMKIQVCVSVYFKQVGSWKHFHMLIKTWTKYWLPAGIPLRTFMNDVIKLTFVAGSTAEARWWKAQNVTRALPYDVMQLVMLNFLIMFDIVFIFFLFLIAVTCVMNYMPGKSRRQEAIEDEVEDDVIPPPPLFDDTERPSSRDTYVVIAPPLENSRVKDGCPVHVV